MKIGGAESICFYLMGGCDPIKPLMPLLQNPPCATGHSQPHRPNSLLLSLNPLAALSSIVGHLSVQGTLWLMAHKDLLNSVYVTRTFRINTVTVVMMVMLMVILNDNDNNEDADNDDDGLTMGK